MAGPGRAGDRRRQAPPGLLPARAAGAQTCQPRTRARTRKKGTLTMSDHLAAHRPPTIRNLPTRTRRFAIGAAAVIPALLIGVLGSTHPGTPQDSGLVACTYPLSTQDVPAADYPKLRPSRRLALAGPAQRRDRLHRSGHPAAQCPGHRRIPDRLVLPAAVRRLRKGPTVNDTPRDRTRVRPDPRRPHDLAAPDTGIAVNCGSALNAIWSICRRHQLSGASTGDAGQSVCLPLADQLDRIRDLASSPGWPPPPPGENAAGSREQRGNGTLPAMRWPPRTSRTSKPRSPRIS